MRKIIHFYRYDILYIYTWYYWSLTFKKTWYTLGAAVPFHIKQPNAAWRWVGCCLINKAGPKGGQKALIRHCFISRQSPLYSTWKTCQNMLNPRYHTINFHGTTGGVDNRGLFFETISWDSAVTKETSFSCQSQCVDKLSRCKRGVTG